MTDEKTLVAFARDVLLTLEVNEEWDADTIDAIGTLAIDRGLADTDEQGYFRRTEVSK